MEVNKTPTSNATKVLTLITHDNNDKASHSYIKRIQRTIDNDKLPILLNKRHCKTQSDLEYFLENSDGKVLLLTPTNLKLHKNDQDRNAEQHQTAMYVVDEIRKNYENQLTKILIVGKGVVGKKIFEELCIKSGYCCTMHGRDFKMYSDFSSQFDIVINAVSQDTKTELFVNCDCLFDISGNFTPIGKEVNLGQCPRSGHVEYAYVDSKVKDEYSIRDIGKQTVYRLLEEVKNS